MKKWTLLALLFLAFISFQLACNTDTTLGDESNGKAAEQQSQEVVADAGQNAEVAPEKVAEPKPEKVAEPKPEKVAEPQPEEKATPDEPIPNCPLHQDLRNHKLPCSCFGQILRDPDKDMPNCKPPNKVACCPGRRRLVCD